MLWVAVLAVLCPLPFLVSAQTPPASQPAKLVVAHFMVGNTFPYTVADWTKDISLAASKGIDGFALNMGRDDWQAARVADAFAAAQASGTAFKLFISFDMASLPCAKATDGDFLRSLINTYHQHPSYMQYNNRPLVSTFAGEICTFGASSLNSGWTNTLKTAMPDIHFVPSFFVDPSLYQSISSADGAFSWDSAWPMGNYDISADYDKAHIANLNGRTYMAAVSPWFFTHYNTESLNKNFIFRGDDWLFAHRWEILVQGRQTIDLVELLTWNDYGESHYIGPISGAQPNSEAWTSGYDHQGWLDLMSYYITAFKTGTYPTITKDRIFLWSRLYPATADAPDPVGKPMNYEYTKDVVWGIVLLTDSSHFEMSCGSSQLSMELPSGPNKVSLSLMDECSVTSAISRAGAATLTFTPPGLAFKKSPALYNFNAFVAASDS